MYFSPYSERSEDWRQKKKFERVNQVSAGHNAAMTDVMGKKRQGSATIASYKTENEPPTGRGVERSDCTTNHDSKMDADCDTCSWIWAQRLRRQARPQRTDVVWVVHIDVIGPRRLAWACWTYCMLPVL